MNTTATATATATAAPTLRTETDLLGSVDIPADRYWGIHTARALANFPITETTVGGVPALVDALAVLKEAAAVVNARHALIDATAQTSIIAACRRIRSGRFADRLPELFPLSMIQGGAGTSTNMNANEVIANIALEHLGLEKGRYDAVDPHNDVNCSQSTNDVYPSALKIALLAHAASTVTALRRVARSWRAKAVEFDDILKLGRTQLQDAVPMTLGRELTAFAAMAEDDAGVLDRATDGLRELNIGGTAVGTGLNAPAGYTAEMVAVLNDLTGLKLRRAPDLVAATADVAAFVDLSAALKRAALHTSKVCHDLRLLSSGPRSGIGDLTLPAVQAGSSIMPGKVNPVIPEAVNQVAFEIVGVDTTVSMAADNGQLQLNAFEPVIAHVLFQGLDHFTRALDTLRLRCIDGITCDEAHVAKLREDVWSSASLATALSPWIGYRQATTVARESQRSGRSVVDIVRASGMMTGAELGTALSTARLTTGA
ncbi:aspartate ammonia-lyase [uncultured Corynebacterium sp.]|mgnify:CR=1 FL=1|uniref:aspartate ammonia-lyase n=1 Tax=uncultured Corynebacterium sp. TaxID=159447 RepID=UPI0025D0C8B0|nr:aspartate ammonia-lyase [uncultured Corynebacterium sp.]